MIYGGLSIIYAESFDKDKTKDDWSEFTRWRGGGGADVNQ